MNMIVPLYLLSYRQYKFATIILYHLRHKPGDIFFVFILATNLNSAKHLPRSHGDALAGLLVSDANENDSSSFVCLC